MDIKHASTNVIRMPERRPGYVDKISYSGAQEVLTVRVLGNGVYLHRGVPLLTAQYLYDLLHHGPYPMKYWDVLTALQRDGIDVRNSEFIPIHTTPSPRR
jgi:hypothetical protein